MPGWISPWELVLLVFILLLIFGPKRLPEMGRSMGRGIREFKNSVTGVDLKAEPETPKAELPEPSASEQQAERPAEKIVS